MLSTAENVREDKIVTSRLQVNELDDLSALIMNAETQYFWENVKVLPQAA